MKINTNEVLDAAATKWNFHKYVPGLVGGHCIGVDPYYLTYKAKKIGYDSKIVLAGRKLNDQMANYIAGRTNKYLKYKKSKILILGCTFKENCNDTKNSKVFDLYKRLKNVKHKIDICDPLVDKNKVKNNYMLKIKSKPRKHYYDCIILAVNHDIFSFKSFAKPKENFGTKESFLFDLKSFYKKNYADYNL